MTLWYLHVSDRRPAKAQASLRVRAVSPEPSLYPRSLAKAFAVRTHEVWKYTKGPIRNLSPLDGCACAFEERVYGRRNIP